MTTIGMASTFAAGFTIKNELVSGIVMCSIIETLIRPEIIHNAAPILLSGKGGSIPTEIDIRLRHFSFCCLTSFQSGQ